MMTLPRKSPSPAEEGRDETVEDIGPRDMCYAVVEGNAGND